MRVEDHLWKKIRDELAGIEVDGISQDVFASTPANCEHAMRRNLRYSLLKVVVHLVFCLFGFFSGCHLRPNGAFAEHPFAKLLPEIGPLRYSLRRNVKGAF